MLSRIEIIIKIKGGKALKLDFLDIFGVKEFDGLYGDLKII